MTEMKSTMENKQFNIMGSEVVDGFACKPKKLDPDKPIMHFKTQIFVCHDERCQKAHKTDDLAANLREILKRMNLAKGANRIKISRTGCFGACRFRSVANIYENTRSNGHANNNNIWIKNVHQFDEKRWEDLFIQLSSNKNIDDSDFEQIPMSSEDCYK